MSEDAGNEREPQGVRVVLDTGEEVRCVCLRVPEMDSDGVRGWGAVPLQDTGDAAITEVRFDRLPAKTKVVVATVNGIGPRVERVGGEDG